MKNRKLLSAISFILGATVTIASFYFFKKESTLFSVDCDKLYVDECTTVHKIYANVIEGNSKCLRLETGEQVCSEFDIDYSCVEAEGCELFDVTMYKPVGGRSQQDDEELKNYFVINRCAR